MSTEDRWAHWETGRPIWNQQKVAYYHHWWDDRFRDMHWSCQVVYVLFVSAILALVFGFIWACYAMSQVPPLPDEPCSHWRDMQVQYIPARCLNYYKEVGR